MKNLGLMGRAVFLSDLIMLYLPSKGHVSGCIPSGNIHGIFPAQLILFHNNPYIHGKQQRSLFGPLQCGRQPGTERGRHPRQRRQFCGFARRVLHKSLRNPAHQFGQHGLQARSGRCERHQLSNHPETVTASDACSNRQARSGARRLSAVYPPPYSSVGSIPVFKNDFRLRLIP